MRKVKTLSVPRSKAFKVPRGTTTILSGRKVKALHLYCHPLGKLKTPQLVGDIDKTRQMKKEAKSPGREAIPREESEPKEAKEKSEEAKGKDGAQLPILFRFTFLPFSFTFL